MFVYFSFYLTVNKDEHIVVLYRTCHVRQMILCWKNVSSTIFDLRNRVKCADERRRDPPTWILPGGRVFDIRWACYSWNGILAGSRLTTRQFLSLLSEPISRRPSPCGYGLDAFLINCRVINADCITLRRVKFRTTKKNNEQNTQLTSNLRLLEVLLLRLTCQSKIRNTLAEGWIASLASGEGIVTLGVCVCDCVFAEPRLHATLASTAK